MSNMNEVRDQIKMRKEKSRSDISTFSWAFVLLWAGIVLLMDNLGYFHRWLSSISWLPEKAQSLSAFSIIFLGAGIIFFIEAILRIALPNERSHFMGPLIMAAVGIGVGLGDVLSWSLIGPFLLIAIGIAFLLRGIVSHKNPVE